MDLLRCVCWAGKNDQKPSRIRDEDNREINHHGKPRAVGESLDNRNIERKAIEVDVSIL